MNIIITSPNLDPAINVSGISSVAQFIKTNNKQHSYYHVVLGKRDNEGRGAMWLYRLLKSYFTYFKSLLSNNIKLVHFNFPLSKAAIYRDAPIIFVTRLFKCKLIIHLHGGEFLLKESLPNDILFILKYILSGNETKIVLSELEKDVITKKFGSSNIKILPNAVDLPDPLATRKLVNSNNTIRVLYLGRIVKSKGIDIIVDAFKLLHKQNIDILFSCAGTGDDKDFFIKALNEVMGNKFSYLGVLKNRDKVQALKNNDIFLLPSLFGEGLPMALLEAMSFGLVPIVTDDGSIKDVISDRENGFLVRKSSPDDIASKITLLDRNRTLLEALSYSATLRIYQNFNPNLYFNKLNEIYGS